MKKASSMDNHDHDDYWVIDTPESEKWSVASLKLINQDVKKRWNQRNQNTAVKQVLPNARRLIETKDEAEAGNHGTFQKPN
jgi:hypothetical protein